MNRILFSIILILFCSISFGQKRIYKDFGNWTISHGFNKVSINGYVTFEESIKYEKSYIKNVDYSEQKRGNFPEKIKKEYYIYELYLISSSIYNGDITSTWINGARIFINENEVTKEQFPEGFIISVSTKPTLIYGYEAPKKDIVNISITWEDAIYEPRIRK